MALDGAIVTHSLRRYTRAEGELVSAPIPVPAGAIAVHVEITREGLPDTTDEVIRGRIELSVDGGLTWSPSPSGELVWPWGVFPVAFGVLGGELRNQEGELTSSAVFDIPLPEAENIQVRTALLLLADVEVSMNVIFTAPKT